MSKSEKIRSAGRGENRADLKTHFSGLADLSSDPARFGFAAKDELGAIEPSSGDLQVGHSPIVRVPAPAEANIYCGSCASTLGPNHDRQNTPAFA